MSSVLPYVTGGFQTLAGAGLTATGNPMGIPMMLQGGGQLVGAATGAPSGPGGMAPAGSGMGIGATAPAPPPISFSAPGTAGTPSIANLGSALSSNPATAGITPNMVSGVSPVLSAPPPSSASTTPSSVGGTNPQPNPYAATGYNQSPDMSNIGNAYLQYLEAKMQRQAPATTLPTSAQPQFSILPQFSFALPGLSV